jgi:hypothetical protein
MDTEQTYPLELLQRFDVFEIRLWCFFDGYRLVLRVNGHVDFVPVERRQRVFQPDTEFPDYLVRVVQLLFVFVLREVLVA